MFLCDYSKSFENSFFYKKTLMAALELSFSIRKEFYKRKLVER